MILGFRWKMVDWIGVPGDGNTHDSGIKNGRKRERMLSFAGQTKQTEEMDVLEKTGLGRMTGIRTIVGQALGAAMQVAGTVTQAIGAAKNNKKYGKIAQGIRQRRGDLASMYKEKLATPYTQTAEGANAARMMRDQADKNARSQTNSAIRTGASPEAVVAAAGASQAANAQAIGSMAAQGTARQDNMRQDMISQLSALDNQYDQMRLKQIQASNEAYANLAQGMSQMGGSLAGGLPVK